MAGVSAISPKLSYYPRCPLGMARKELRESGYPTDACSFPLGAGPFLPVYGPTYIKNLINELGDELKMIIKSNELIALIKIDLTHLIGMILPKEIRQWVNPKNAKNE